MIYYIMLYYIILYYIILYFIILYYIILYYIILYYIYRYVEPKINALFNQWEFQDPKMEVLYHIRPYFVGIFLYIGLT